MWLFIFQVSLVTSRPKICTIVELVPSLLRSLYLCLLVEVSFSNCFAVTAGGWKAAGLRLVVENIFISVSQDIFTYLENIDMQ